MKLLIKSRKLQGRINFHGLNISLETGRSRIREWFNPHDQTQGMSLMKYAYGYFTGGIQGVDGDGLDVLVGPDTSATEVYVIHTMKAPDFQEYDEDKTVIQCPSAEEARNAFLMSYNDPHFYGGMTTYTVEEFIAKITHPEFSAQKLEKSQMKRLLEQLHVQQKEIDIDEFNLGMEQEAEHKDVTGGDPVKTAKIVMAHLKEDRHYYSKLEQMEKAKKLKYAAGIFY